MITASIHTVLPLEMFGSCGTSDGVYPAYHMNKLHWISVLLPDAADDLVQFLANASYEVTRERITTKKKTLPRA